MILFSCRDNILHWDIMCLSFPTNGNRRSYICIPTITNGIVLSQFFPCFMWRATVYEKGKQLNLFIAVLRLFLSPFQVPNKKRNNLAASIEYMTDGSTMLSMSPSIPHFEIIISIHMKLDFHSLPKGAYVVDYWLKL